MANIKQKYNLGELFQLCSWNELSTADITDWAWPYRILSGFKLSDGRFIEPGSMLSLDVQESQISGIWTLDKSSKIVLCCLGETGDVSVRVIEKNTALPLADQQHPYGLTTYLSSTTEHNFYVYSNISVDFIPSEETTIKSVKYQLYHDFSQVYDNDPPTKQIVGYYDTDAYGNKNLYISVDYVQGGILEYFSNKNARNE